MRVLLWLFLAAPLIELWLMIRVGSSIGALSTIALLIGAGILGGALLRRQSFEMLLRVDQRLQQGQMPAEEILESFALTLAAVCLMIPGFITDILAAPLLIGPLRRWLIRRYLGSLYYQQHQRHESKIIEGDWQREDDPRLNRK
jgi:UPF0716 protein FxsA